MSTYIKITDKRYQGMETPDESFELDDRLADLDVEVCQVQHYPTLDANFLEFTDDALSVDRIMELLRIDDYVEVTEEEFINRSDLVNIMKKLNGDI